jgi:ABC-type antimicrobial peptide transport system permease subunit
MTAGLLENIGIVTMLLSHPRKPPAVALLASAFSTVKWTAITAESVLVIVGLVAWLIHRMRRTGE